MNHHDLRLLVFLAAATSFINNNASAQSIQFPERQYYAGQNPFGVALGDVNNDGKLDAAVANLTSPGTFTLLRGVNPGFGAAASLLNMGINPRFSLIRDLNGDGKMDVLVVNGETAGTVYYRFGNGNFTFQSSASFSVGQSPTHADTGDFNGDGKLDIAVADWGNNKVSIAMNSGSSFPTIIHMDGGGGAHFVQIADINNDGSLDIGVADITSNEVSIIRGDGAGAFLSPYSWPTGGPASSLGFGDVNNDGSPDFVVSLQTSPSGGLAVLLGSGNGAFDAPAVQTIDKNPFALRLRDVNGDGKLDAITTHPDTNRAGVATGTGAGGFNAQKLYYCGTSPFYFDIGDFTYDGKPDLLAANNYATSPTNPGLVTSILNDGIGGFVVPAVTNVGAGAYDMDVADLNHDGFADVVTANKNGFSSTISAIYGDGTGNFTNPGNVVAGPWTSAVTLGDFNNDGNMDAVTAGQSTNVIVYRPGDNAGGFGAGVSYTAGSSPLSITRGDYNSDGFLDVVTGNLDTSNISINFGNGAGFSAPTNINVGPTPYFIATADFQGDGASDLLVALQNSSKFRVLLGDGAGGFPSNTQYTNVGGFPSGIAVGDLNGDQINDLAIANNSGHTISVWKGTGGGAIVHMNDYSIGRDPFQCAVTDFNNDGRKDLVTACQMSSDFIVSIQSAAGDLNIGIPFATPFRPNDIFIFDANLDGRADVATASEVSNTVAVSLNLQAAQPGTSLYGTGTAGCFGSLAMSANVAPNVNTPNFALLCTNAPKLSLGLGLATDSQDLAGTNNAFGLGFRLHVDLAFATELYAFDFISDESGVGIAPAPIDNIPSLAGRTFYAQAIWVETPLFSCGDSPFGFVASKGMSVTIGP